MILSSENLDDSNIPYLAFSSIKGEEDAKKLARELLSSQLAACIQIVPKAISLFTWQGEIEEAEESLLFIKTRKGHLEALEKKISAFHPYDIPEFVCIELNSGSQEYLSWLIGNTGG